MGRTEKWLSAGNGEPESDAGCLALAAEFDRAVCQTDHIRVLLSTITLFESGPNPDPGAALNALAVIARFCLAFDELRNHFHSTCRHRNRPPSALHRRFVMLAQRTLDVLKAA